MKDHGAFELTYCRLCKSKDLKLVIDLGKSALPNAILKKSELKKAEPIFPLKVNFCTNCGQVQLSHVVSPELMFRNYAYVSSTSGIMMTHFEGYAHSVFKNLKLKRGDLVVEMGSNDGYLLKQFKKLGAKVLGVDPARNVAKRANKEGIPTLPEFFDSKVAKKIVEEYGKVKVICGNNVFAHINDLDEVVKGVEVLLDENGAFIIEFPYLVNLIDDNVFDSIYHEHLSYLAVKPLNHFFNSLGMEIFNVVKTAVQGGSIMVFVKKQGGEYKTTSAVKEFLNLEKEKKLDEAQTYLEFAKKVQTTKKSLNELITKLKRQNKTIIGYGAPGRSTTLLTYFEIDNKILDYIVDDNPYKIGYHTPGTHIPILGIPEIEKTNPDYLLILSWNYADPIMKKLSSFKKSGGHFIIPVPKPKII